MREILETNGKIYVGVPGGDCYDCCFSSRACVLDNGVDHRCSDKNLHWNETTKKVFSNDQHIHAVESFLEYGERMYSSERSKDTKGHNGYFSGGGWAARCLRDLLEDLKRNDS